MIHQDNRTLMRREADRMKFESCPKYVRHDLSEEQIIDIVERIRAKDNEQLGLMVKDVGKKWLPNILFGIGACVYVVIRYLESKGFYIP